MFISVPRSTFAERVRSSAVVHMSRSCIARIEAWRVSSCHLHGSLPRRHCVGACDAVERAHRRMSCLAGSAVLHRTRGKEV